MNLLNVLGRWFGAGAKPNEVAGEAIEYHTNAPESWKPFKALPLPLSVNPKLDAFLLMSPLMEHLKWVQGRVKFEGMMLNRLLAEGAIRVSYVLSVKGIKYWILVFGPGWDLQFAADVMHLLGKASAEGRCPKVIYFSSNPLPSPGLKKDPLNQFSFGDFELVKEGGDEEGMPKGHYAMWWNTDDDDDPATSPLMGLWTQIYEKSEGFYPYICALMKLQIFEEESGPIRLPESMVEPVQLPNDVRALLCVSQEKGIRLQFHVDSTKKSDARLILEHYLKLSQTIAEQAAAAGHPKDTGDLSPLGWWKLVYATVTQEGRKGERVGLRIV